MDSQVKETLKNNVFNLMFQDVIEINVDVIAQEAIQGLEVQFPRIIHSEGGRTRLLVARMEIFPNKLQLLLNTFNYGILEYFREILIVMSLT